MQVTSQFSNDLQLRIIGNGKYQENLKTSQNYNLVVSLPPKIKSLPILAINS